MAPRQRATWTAAHHVSSSAHHTSMRLCTRHSPTSWSAVLLLLPVLLLPVLLLPALLLAVRVAANRAATCFRPACFVTAHRAFSLGPVA